MYSTFRKLAIFVTSSFPSQQYPAIPAGFPFFSLRAQRKEPKERAARPLRRPRSPRCGTGEAKTRCAQTVCLFIRFRTPPTGSAARAPIFPGYISSWKVASQRGKQREQFVGWGEARTPTFKIAHKPASSCTQNVLTDNGLTRLCIDISSRVQHFCYPKVTSPQ